jgi:hypothetical protein
MRREAMRRSGLALFVLALLVAAPAAHADSVVYIKNNNVWLANADGSGQYQVTLDGTAGDAYESPSQSDDGTIAAIRGSGSNEMLYLMRQNGSLLVPPFEPAVEFSLGLFDAAISPDGDRIAYWTGFFGNSSCEAGSSGTTACFTTEMSPSTGPGDLGGDARVSDPSWVSDTRIMTTVTGFAYLQDVGTLGGTQWFTDIDTFGTVKSFYDGEVAPTGDRLALVEDDSSQADTIRFWRTNGNPASGTPSSVPDPTPTNCGLQGPAGLFADPTWSEDGELLAWEEDDGDPATTPGTGQGVWTMTVGTSPPPPPPSTDCSGFGTPQLVIPGGLAPDLSPAPVNPGPRDTGGGGGGIGGGGGGIGGGGGGTGGGGGGTVDTDRPDGTAKLAGRPPSLGDALRRGIAVRASSDEAGRVTVELLAKGRYARGLSGAAAATRRVGVGRRQLAAPGRVRVVARFTTKAKRRYRRLRRLPLTVRVTLADAAGNRTVRRLRVTLRR